MDWQPRFLEELTRWGVVDHACREAGIHRSTAYRAYKSDPDFAERWDEAERKIIATAEVVARQRALIGTARPVYFQGKQIDTIMEVDNAHLRWLLSKLKPEVYGDKIDLSLHHSGNVNVEFYLPDNGRDPEEALLARDDPDPAPGR